MVKPPAECDNGQWTSETLECICSRGSFDSVQGATWQKLVVPKWFLQTRFLHFKSKITERLYVYLYTSPLTLSKTSTFIHISLLLLPVAQHFELLPCSIPWKPPPDHIFKLFFCPGTRLQLETHRLVALVRVFFACKVGWSNGGLLALISSHVPP